MKLKLSNYLVAKLKWAKLKWAKRKRAKRKRDRNKSVPFRYSLIAR